jgi:hypothetical protein
VSAPSSEVGRGDDLRAAHGTQGQEGERTMSRDTVTGHEYTATRVRGLAGWSPKPETLRVVAAVQAVLDEYQAYLPLTVRQVFYRLVGAHGYAKTEQAYSRLLEYLNRARRAGLINWSSIRDDGFDSTGGGGWPSPQRAIDAMIRTAGNYTRNRQAGQDVFTEIWVEAAGMMPQVAQMVGHLSIPVYSSGGFNSVTAKHDTARRIMWRHRSEDRQTRILHVGDYDPSGVAIIDSLADDIGQFLADMGNPWAATFVRVAVTPPQIAELGLPGAPAKRTDRRANFSDLTVQAEALSPPQLEELLLNAVADEWSDDVFEELLVTEAAERAALIAALEGIEL